MLNQWVMKNVVAKSRSIVIALAMAANACSDADVSSEPVSEVSEPLIKAFLADFDTTIQDNTGNQGADTRCQARNETGATGVARFSCLLHFPFGGFPPNTLVTNVSLRLDVLNSSTQEYQLYTLDRQWDEMQATWFEKMTGVPWANPGVRWPDRGIGPTEWATFPSLGERKIPIPGVVQDVQGWILQPQMAWGLQITSHSNTDGVIFASSEHPTSTARPLLIVEYVLQ